MREMTPEEYRSFMLGTARTAILATVRPDGRPHVAPVWFDLDGEDLIFMTGESTVKGRNIQNNPQVSLCIDDEKPPFHFVLFNGTARMTGGDPDMLHWSTSIGSRYMGAELGEEYGRRNAVEGELLVRVRPDKVIARKNVTD